MLSRSAATWLVLLGLLWAAVAEAEHFKGECENSVTLGSDRWPELQKLYAAVREQLKVGKVGAAIELQRKVVELQCHNHFQRYYLAELMVQSGRMAEAVAVLQELYDLQVNDLEERLANEKNVLHPITASDAFAGSGLARELAAKRGEFEARRKAFLAKLSALGAAERPPDPYVARDVCPFECCTYRRWSVTEDTPLVAAPNSDAIVGTAKKDTHVEGITGEVHRAPVPVGVVHPEPAYQPNATIAKGEIVFLLDYMGEGFAHIWHAGVVREMSTSGEVQDHCPFPADDCWGERLVLVDPEPDYHWWVKVRLPDGTIGWTREINFGDIDACG